MCDYTRNNQFALGYFVSVFLVGTFQGGLSQGNPLEDLVHVSCFCERQSYYIIYVSFVLFHCVFLFVVILSFCFIYHNLSFGTLSLIIHLLVHSKVQSLLSI